MVINIAFYENVLFILSLSRNREFTLASCESYLAPRIQRAAPRQSTPRTPQTTFHTPQTTPPPPPAYQKNSTGSRSTDLGTKITGRIVFYLSQTS